MSPFETVPRVPVAGSIKKAAQDKSLLDMWDKERNATAAPDVPSDSIAVRSFVCPVCGEAFSAPAMAATRLGSCLRCFNKEHPDLAEQLNRIESEMLPSESSPNSEKEGTSAPSLDFKPAGEAEARVDDGTFECDVVVEPGDAVYANVAKVVEASFPTVVSECASWAADVRGGGPIEQAAENLATLERCEIDGARCRVSSVLTALDGDAPIGRERRCWVCEVVTKPGGKKGRGRSSRVVANVFEDSGGIVVAAVEMETRGRGKRTPPIAAALFARLAEALRCESFGEKATARPRPFTREETGDLTASLYAASRTLPLVMACDDGQGSWPMNPFDVARDVAGLAEVWSFQMTDPDVADAVRDFFGGPGQTPLSLLAPTLGRIDVYDDGSGLFGPDSASMRGVTAVEWPTARSMVYALGREQLGTLRLHSPAHAAAYLDRVEESREAERAEAEQRALEEAEARLAKQRAEQDAAMTPLERARALSRAAEELASSLARDEEARADAEELSRAKADLAALEADLSEANSALAAESALRAEAEAAAEAAKQAEADAVQLAEEAERERNAAVSKAAHADELSKLVDALKQENARLAEHDSALRDLERLPSTEAEALELAAKAFSDRVVVLPAALDSARDHDGSADETWRIVRAIARVLWPLRFERDEVGERLDVAFRERTGFELSTAERDLTKRMLEERTRSYKGRKVIFGDHVKGTSGPRSKLLRVHIAYDDEDRVIVIGHCGAHLTNNATRHFK